MKPERNEFIVLHYCDRHNKQHEKGDLGHLNAYSYLTKGAKHGSYHCKKTSKKVARSEKSEKLENQKNQKIEKNAKMRKIIK